MIKMLMTKAAAKAFMVGFTVSLVTVFVALEASATSNINDPEYWKAQYPNAVECYKYDPPGTPNSHGSLSADKKSVTLNTFNQAWPGDHWAVLVVKGGSKGRTVVTNPVAGVAYQAPLNAGGTISYPDVSHWIVCKGETPSPSPEPSSDPSPSPSPTPGPPVVVPPVFTPPTCQSVGEVEAPNTETYWWDFVGAENVLTFIAYDYDNNELERFGPFDLRILDCPTPNPEPTPQPTPTPDPKDCEQGEGWNGTQCVRATFTG